MKVVAKSLTAVVALIVAGFAGVAPSAHGQGGVPLWTNRFVGPTSGYNPGIAEAVDGNGNVFVTGYRVGNNGKNDYVTLAYSNSGVPLWTNYYNGPANGDSYTRAVVVDNAGNVFVTGKSANTNGDFDYATIKYSGTGTPLWTNRYSHGSTSAMVLGTNGNLFITGRAGLVAYSSSGQILWTNNFAGAAIAIDNGNTIFVTGELWSGTSFDYATVAYSGAGIPLWTNLYIGAANQTDSPQAIAVDGSGSVVVTGESWNGTSDDFLTVAYSNGGSPLWTNRYDGPVSGEDLDTSLAVDGNGTVFVTGESASSSGFEAHSAYATVAYSNTGVPLWTNRFRGPDSTYNDFPKAIAVDTSGNVFVTGRSGNTFGVSSDYATVGYSGTGIPLWTNRYHQPGTFAGDVANAIKVDGDGNVFITGASGGENGLDIVTIKYSSSLPVIRLSYQCYANKLVLNWTNIGFSLQSAPFASGEFTNISGATSPYTNSPTATQRFFRLKSN